MLTVAKSNRINTGNEDFFPLHFPSELQELKFKWDLNLYHKVQSHRLNLTYHALGKNMKGLLYSHTKLSLFFLGWLF